MAENNGNLTKSFVVVKKYLMQIDLIKQCVCSYNKIFHYECLYQWRKNYQKIAISNDVLKQADIPPLMNLFTNATILC